MLVASYFFLPKSMLDRLLHCNLCCLWHIQYIQGLVLICTIKTSTLSYFILITTLSYIISSKLNLKQLVTCRGHDASSALMQL